MRQIKFRGKCVEEFHTHHEQTEPGQAQTRYFQTKSKDALNKAKKLEKQVDNILSKVLNE